MVLVPILMVSYISFFNAFRYPPFYEFCHPEGTLSFLTQFLTNFQFFSPSTFQARSSYWLTARTERCRKEGACCRR